MIFAPKFFVINKKIDISLSVISDNKSHFDNISFLIPLNFSAKDLSSDISNFMTPFFFIL